MPEENVSLAFRAECEMPGNFQSTPPFLSSLWAPTFPSIQQHFPLSQSERLESLGPYLAAMPTSMEERIPADTSNALLANTSYSLQEAWAHLPTPVRVYLDQLQLKTEQELSIAYESPSPDFPEGRWRVFKTPPKNDESALLGMGALGFFKRWGTSPLPASNPETPPPQNSSVNVKIGSFILGGVIVVGIDLGIQKAFPFLPTEARAIPNLASFYGLQYILWQTGLINASSWREVWKPFTSSLPVIVMLGIPTSTLVDRVGRLFELDALRKEGSLHTPFTMLSSLALYWKLMQSPAGRNFLTATGTGMSATLGKAMRITGSFFILSALARGGRSGGSYLGLYAGGCRPGDYTWQEGLLNMHAEKVALAESSQDIFGNNGGAFIDATLGGLVDLVLSLGEFVSEKIERGRQMHIDEIKDMIVEKSDNAAQEIEEKLAFALSEALQADGKINWDMMQASISEIYASEEVMNAMYQAFSLIAHRNKTAANILSMIDANGNILNQNTLIESARSHAKTWLKENQQKLKQRQLELDNLGKSIGVYEVIQDKLGNKHIKINPAENLSPAQHARMEAEFIPLNGEIEPLEILEEAMLKLTSNFK